MKKKKNSIISVSVKVFYIAFSSFIFLNVIDLFTSAETPQNNESDIKNDEGLSYPEKFDRDYNIYAVDLPEQVDFCGEKMPLDNFDVREGLDMEILINTYYQSHTLLIIKRANRFFPIIEPILKKNGIPDDFKYLAVIESSLSNAISPSNAVGLWQFLKETAREYGLEVNSEIDERYHYEKSTEAACRYLNKQYELFGNWTLTAASYNAGRNGVNTQIQRQNSDSFYDLLLVEETTRYIYRIVALKLILQNPEKYGFHFRKEDLYPLVPTYTVQVDSAVTDFADFAHQYEISYMMLKRFNPWLRQAYLSNKRKKTYAIKIPKKGYRSLKKLFGTNEP